MELAYQNVSLAQCLLCSPIHLQKTGDFQLQQKHWGFTVSWISISNRSRTTLHHYQRLGMECDLNIQHIGKYFRLGSRLRWCMLLLLLLLLNKGRGSNLRTLLWTWPCNDTTNHHLPLYSFLIHIIIPKKIKLSSCLSIQRQERVELLTYVACAYVQPAFDNCVDTHWVRCGAMVVIVYY